MPRSKRPPRRIWVALGLSGQWYGCTFQWVKRAIPYVPEVRRKARRKVKRAR